MQIPTIQWILGYRRSLQLRTVQERFETGQHLQAPGKTTWGVSDPELGPPGALGWIWKFADFKYALMPDQVDISDISGFWVNKSRIEGTYLSDRTSFVYETDKE